MEKDNNHFRYAVLISFVLLAVLTRVVAPPLLGHASNFAPIGAISLFSGAYFGRKWFAFFLPLFSLWISDIFINYMYLQEFVWYYKGFYWQYGSFALIVVSGFWLNKGIKAGKVLGGSLSASVLFFIISNFGVWAGGHLYPMNWSGLSACYIAGIPFFGKTLMSDLIYSAVLFGGFEFAKYKFPVLARNTNLV